MPERYPWNILELSDEYADERAVRAAYARKLKQCRPDEDPEGFQLLLQARNHALLCLRSMDSVHDDACVWKDAGDGRTEKCGNNSIGQDGNCNTALPDFGTEPDNGPNFEVKPGNGQERFPRRYFEEKLEEMSNPFLDIWQLSYWHDFFDALNSAGYHCRQDIEWLLIRQVGSRLFESSPPAGCHTSPDEPGQDTVQNVLSLLDDEFGWTENDQKIYRVLGHDEADLFLTLIRSGSSPKGQKGREAKAHVAVIPYIAITDLRAFTGDSGEDIVQYYMAACQSGHWGQGLDWSGFLFGYIWHVWHILWKASLAIILLQVLVIALMASVTEFQPFLYGMVAGLLSVLPLLYIARYGKYQIVHFAIETIKNAEDIPFRGSLERYHYLKKRGRASAFFTLLMVSAPFIIVYIIHFLKI